MNEPMSGNLIDPNSPLGTVVVKNFATATPEDRHIELALVVAAVDAPTFTLLDHLGNEYPWRQDLTRPATPEETARYWKLRALQAERERDALRAQSSIDLPKDAADIRAESEHRRTPWQSSPTQVTTQHGNLDEG